MKIFSLASLALTGIVLGSTNAMAANMSDAEYKAQKDRIESSYKVAKEKCDSLSGNAEDVCTEEAKGRYKVDKANLEATRNPSNENQYNARIAKIDADYEIAKEKCDDLEGNAEDACVAEAKAVKERATSDAKAQMKP